jgi:hypothetical protein
MADFFKGLAGGFGTGLQFGQAIRERNMRDELAQAYAKPEEFTDYTPEQTREIQRLQGTGAYDVQAVPGAEGAVPTLRFAPRQGLDLQGDMPAAPVDIAPGQVQRFGGQTAAGRFDPTQLRGLQMQEAARVLGSYGDVRGAAALQAQADEQAYQARIRPLQEEQLRGSIAGQAQQRELTGIQLGSAKRTEAELQRASDFSNFAAENPNATVAELKEAAFKQFKFTPKQWQETVTTRLGIENAEMDSFKNGIKKKLQGKNLSQLGSLYNSDPDFDDKTDLAIVPGKGGAVTLNFIDKASGRVTSTQSFKNEALATEYLNKQATEPENIGSWMLALRKTESGIEAQGAATEASRATVGLRNAQMRQISNQEAASAEAQQIRAQFMALSDDDQAGPRGLALRQAFTMANAKAGAVVPLGAPPRAATGPARELSDLDKENLREYREWVKDPRNAKLPQGQKDAYAAQLGVTEFVNRAAAGPQAGIGSNPYATPQPGAAPAASQPAQLSLGTAVPPRAGLVTPAQAAAAQTTQARQTAAQAQQATQEGMRTQGVIRQNYALQQEAASLTPAVIRQLTPTQATEAIRVYGQFLTPEQRREVNRRQ